MASIESSRLRPGSMSEVTNAHAMLPIYDRSRVGAASTRASMLHGTGRTLITRHTASLTGGYGPVKSRNGASIMKCVKCGKESQSTTRCTHCGASFAQVTKSIPKPATAVAAAPAAIADALSVPATSEAHAEAVQKSKQPPKNVKTSTVWTPLTFIAGILFPIWVITLNRNLAQWMHFDAKNPLGYILRDSALVLSIFCFIGMAVLFLKWLGQSKQVSGVVVLFVLLLAAIDGFFFYGMGISFYGWFGR